LGLEVHLITEVYVVHKPGYAENIGSEIANIDGV